MTDEERRDPQAKHEPAEDETEYLTVQLPTSTRFAMRLQVFIPATAIILAFMLAGVIFTESHAEIIQTT